MNKVYLSGKAYARVGIAVNRPFSKEKDAVDFFNLVAWEKRAETMGKYLTKGSKIIVEGRLQTNSYEKDGVKHNVIDIIVDNFEFAGGGKSEGKPKEDYSSQDYDTPF